MTWFKKWFDESYLEVYAHRDREEASKDIDQVEKLLPLRRSQPLLDLACGHGRHSLELAGRGYGVVGLDLSDKLLCIARRDAGEAGLPVRFVRADKRAVPFPAAFGCVLNFFTSFGYFKRAEDNLQVLRNIYNCLRPSGHFLIDHINKEHAVSNLVPEDVRRVNGRDILQRRHYDTSTGRIEKEIVIDDGNSKRTYRESVQLYTREEFVAMAQRAGLAVTRVLGGLDGRSFGPGGSRMVVIGERPDAEG